MKNHKKMAPGKPRSPRQAARDMALQGIYSWLINASKYDEIVAQVKASNQNIHPHANNSKSGSTGKNSSGNRPGIMVYDDVFFEKLLRGVLNEIGPLRQWLGDFLDRRDSELSPMVLAVLLLSSYELKNEALTPAPVILNEAIELARRFASDEAYRYVNGVLERIAASCRSLEISKTKGCQIQKL